jgi:hypothetical protein
MAKAPSMCGHLVMVGAIMTPVQLTATPLASTPSLLGQPITTATRRTMMRTVHPRWP